jgi:hypothetical protein
VRWGNDEWRESLAAHMNSDRDNQVAMHTLRWSLLSAGILVFWSVLPYAFGAGDEPSAGYLMMPGIIFGIYGCMLLSGNPHGIETAPLLIISSIVNFIFWTVVCYAAISIYRRLSKKNVSAK